VTSAFQRSRDSKYIDVVFICISPLMCVQTILCAGGDHEGEERIGMRSTE